VLLFLCNCCCAACRS